MLRHSGGRPYPCNQCNLSFTQSGHLKKHKIKHNLVFDETSVKLEVKLEVEGEVEEGDADPIKLEDLALGICKDELVLS